MSTKLLWHYQLLETPTSQVSQYPDVDLTHQIAEMCSLLLWNLNSIRKCSTSQPVHLIRTAGQSGSDCWHSERSVRITASVAKVVLGLSSDKARMNFMRNHIWRFKPFCNEAMKRGNELEGLARDAYRLHLQELSFDIDILESGTWVNPAHLQLSCSPDGLIVDTNGIIRLLEIKCPEVLTEMDPNNFEQLPKEQLSRFCIRRDKQTKELELKPSHKWYLQVQMSLAIMELEYCDFVVFSTLKGKPKFLKVEVKFDREFWNEKKERLIRIHREWIVPEHFLINTAFNRLPIRLVYTPFHEEHNDNYFLQGSHIPDAYYCSLIETADAFLICDSQDFDVKINHQRSVRSVSSDLFEF
ncbi:Exonuclease [Frankliniella fusca]|uniref:Exonuclease n=1 Tax=Frankliniella fusca TaxID=407009 RepID=A0AAE1L997_9NEOP|nr:Exonuclease [Frankliniella fusca]